METTFTQVRMTGFPHLLSLITLVRDVQACYRNEPGMLDALWNDYNGRKKAATISALIKTGDEVDCYADIIAQQITKYIAQCIWDEAEVLAFEALDKVLGAYRRVHGCRM